MGGAIGFPHRGSSDIVSENDGEIEMGHKINELKSDLFQINATYHHPGQWHDLPARPSQVYNPATSERYQWYVITNLVAESVYECMVQAKNQHGFGELSDPHQWFSSQRGRLLHSGAPTHMYHNFFCNLLISTLSLIATVIINNITK